MFNPLSVPTEAEQAATQGAKSSYYGNLINAGVVSPEEVRQALRQDENSGFTDIAEDLPEDTGGMGGMNGNENGGESQPPNGNSGGGNTPEAKAQDSSDNENKEADYFYTDKNRKVHPCTYPYRLNFTRIGDVDAHFDNSETHKDWKKYIEQNESKRNSIVYYTGPSYEGLNEALRQGEKTPIAKNPLLTTDQCDKIRDLDEVIAQYELERPMRVYRALGIGIIDKFYESKDRGFPEYAYSSTSCSKKASILYQPNTDLLIIDLPKGKGIGAYISDYSAYPKQYEFIIKRGVKFKINEAYEKEMYMWENGIRKLKKRRVFELIFLGD